MRSNFEGPALLLEAFATARACPAAPDAWTEGVDGTLAVLAPPSTHYSVRRSVAMSIHEKRPSRSASRKRVS